MKGKTLLLLLFIVPLFVLMSCSTGLKNIANETPITNSLSHLDFPIYFGKNSQQPCKPILQQEGDILISQEMNQTKEQNGLEKSETTEKKISYFNDLGKKLENIESKGYLPHLPYLRIRETGMVFSIIIVTSGGFRQSFHAKIHACSK